MSALDTDHAAEIKAALDARRLMTLDFRTYERVISHVNALVRQNAALREYVLGLESDWGIVSYHDETSRKLELQRQREEYGVSALINKNP